jgi:hypothetical protein
VDWEKYKRSILEQIDFRSFYVDNLGADACEDVSQTEIRALCPFHDDKKPSFSINVEKGFYYCHSCKAKGNIFSYIMNRYNKTYEETCFLLGDSLGLQRPRSKKPERPPIDLSLVATYHKQLMHNAHTIRAVVKQKCGWTDETLVRFQIGWDTDRITVPICDEYGVLVNIRRYKWDAKKSQDKMVSYADKEGNVYGEARIYGIEDLITSDEIIWCAGEKDRIQLKQQGFMAATVTSGEGIFRPEWIPLFKGKTVYVCQDNDDTGRNAALSICEKLYKVAKVHNVILPEEVGVKGDVTDYFVALGYSAEDFRILLNSTPRYKEEQNFEDPNEQIYEVHLSEASLSKYSGKKIKVPVLISGKDTAPYIIPRHVKVKCTLSEGKKCALCPMSSVAGEKEIAFGPKDPEVLLMIDCTKASQREVIKEKSDIIKGCNAIEMEVIENLNIEEVRLIPQAETTTDFVSEKDYAVRRGFYIGHGIKSNQRYELTGYTFPDPRTQYVTHIFDTAIPAQDSISNFEIDDEIIEQLKVFQCASGQSVKAKFEEIHRDLERNVTKIWGRYLPAMAIDLVYHTVLSFYFQGQFLKKGWSELLILGDPGQGKSTLVEKLMGHFQVGEFINGESSGRTGLVYNLQETQKRWFLSWGKIPLNDRRLLAIDEFSGVTEEDIALMSDVRSSGVARVNKVITAETNARTRLIFLSNPRTGYGLNTFNNGIEAVKTLFGKNEDIRRLDIVVAVASGDIDDTIINRKLDSFPTVRHRYNSDICKNLVLWAWSRKPEHVIFTEGTEERILQKAIEVSRSYSSKIPLVESADQRLKIARLATAAAVRLFNTDDGNRVLVTPEHVDFVVDLMVQSYNHKNLSYDLFSKQAQKDSEFDYSEMKKLALEFAKFSDANALADLLLEYRYFRKSELQAQMDYDKDEINKLLKWMTKNRIIENTSGGFRKKASGIQFLRFVKEHPVEEFDPNSEDSPF